METLELVNASEEWAEAYLDMCREEIAHDASLSGILPMTLDDFSPLLSRWKEQERRGDDATGGVPESRYWLVRNGREVVGEIRLRHYLTRTLEDFGGQLDYGIRSSARRKGYGTRLLALLIEQARRMGMREVLVMCRKTNIGSRRVIERNEGVLLREFPHPRDNEAILSYRIRL